MNTIAPQHGAGLTLRKGQMLWITDPYGKQVCDLFCFNLEDKGESLSAGRSIDYAESIYLSTGDKLYSNRSNVMLSIEKDDCGRHDLLMTPCSLKMFQIVSASELYHPSCHENLSLAFSGYDISADAIGTTFNIFMNVEVSPSGQLKIFEPRSKAGNTICLKAQQNLIVGLTACSHEETNAGECKPINWKITD